MAFERLAFFFISTLVNLQLDSSTDSSRQFYGSKDRSTKIKTISVNIILEILPMKLIG